MILYALRGLAISFSVFVIVYTAMRLAVVCGWPLADRMAKRIRNGFSANTWFALQTGPFAVAALVMCALTIPSFLRFEPRRAEEEFGVAAVLLSVACTFLLAAGIYRAWIAYARTACTVKAWRENATVIRQERFEVIETGPGTPPLAVAGLLRPKLLVSSSAASLLSRDELTRAMAHESTHIQNYDNIKKLMLRLCSFPPAPELERRWLEAIEIAADQHAVSSKREALDLASALVKASKLPSATAELATNLTTDAGYLLQTRVQRLLAWEENDGRRGGTGRYLYVPAIVLVGAISVAAYPFLLVTMHKMAELLMR